MSTNKKNVIIAAVVALVVSLLGSAGFVQTIDTVPVSSFNGEQVDLGAIQGTVMESPYIFKNGAGMGGNHLTFTADGKIEARSNQAFWRNTTGRTVFVDLAEMVTTGVASTTFQFFIGTTTSASITDNFTNPYASLVDAYSLATSSPAWRSVNSIKDPGTNGRGVIPVLSGEYVYFTFQQDNANACTGAICETATSTNRGFNVDWYLRGHFKP